MDGWYHICETYTEVVDNLIPILYSANTTTFTNFGIGHLSDAISPHVVEERNGEFTFEMQYPIFGEHFNDITMRTIILAKPSPAQDPQPFRVYDISKPINGIVTINARHVRYDLEGVPVTPFTASGIADALVKIKEHSIGNTTYYLTTNKTNTQTMTLEVPTPAISLLGGVRGSLLDIYGGEYKYDGYTIQLLNTRGEDKGVVIRYGVDLLDLTQEENCANLYTGVMCFWKSSADNTLVTGEVQSSGTFDYTKIKVVDRSTNYEDAPTVATLNLDALNYINNNKVGVPKVSITLQFANLEQTEEYKNIRQSVELCDQVNVEFEKLGVTAMAKIVRTDFDVITEKYNSVEIGDSRTSMADSFVDVQVRAESAPSTVEMQQAISATTAAITGANGGAVRLLDTNDDKMPDTLYIADNPSPYLAQKVWRFNYEGWGASENGYSGPFTMGATFQAGFIADFITAGTLSADRIGTNSIAVSKLTGRILNGQWVIDLENGTMTLGKLTVGSITGNIENGGWKVDFDNGTFVIGTISANKITSGTIDASQITVTNLNASNITVGTINGRFIEDLSIGGTKLGSGSVTESKIGDLEISGSKLKNSTISGGKIQDLTITGSNIAETTLPGDKLVNHTLGDLQMGVGGLSTASLSGGINKSLGSADLFASSTEVGTSVYPSRFKAGYITAAETFTGRDITVSPSGSEITLGGHYHTITVNGGQVTIGRPYNSNTPPSFNIADTQFYKDGVAAVTVSSLDISYTYDYSMHIYRIDCEARNRYGETLRSTYTNTDRTAYIDGQNSGTSYSNYVYSTSSAWTSRDGHPVCRVTTIVYGVTSGGSYVQLASGTDDYERPY